MAAPWVKFYTSDWRADPRLKMCSAAARGVWIEMICLMHEATPYGHLLIHGQTPNEAQLASLTGIPVAELPDLIAELEQMAVFSRTKEGVIYSRKLVRMESRAAKARKNGKKGGNPKLGKEREKSKTDNSPDKGRDKTQSPESRVQMVEIDKSISCPFSEFWKVWPSKQNKAAAEKAWKKLSPDDRVSARDNAANWFASWRRKNPDANDIHASTYLNNKRWTDESASSGAVDEQTLRWRKMAAGE